MRKQRTIERKTNNREDNWEGRQPSTQRELVKERAVKKINIPGLGNIPSWKLERTHCLN
jgi:hypothetical protein